MKEYLVEAIKKDGSEYLELTLVGSGERLPQVIGITTLAESWAEKSKNFPEWEMRKNEDRLSTIPSAFTTIGLDGRVILHNSIPSEDLVKLTERYIAACQR